MSTSAMPYDPYQHNRPEQKRLRQHLRTHGTPTEGRLWRALQRRQLGGLKFRRQYGVGAYVLDFYCPAARLAVEVDGAVHNDPQQAQYDADRTQALVEQEIHVLRIPNEAVRDDLEGVCALIRGEAWKRLGETP